MSHVMLNIALFDTLGRHFRLFFGDRCVKRMLFFCPQTHLSLIRDRLVLIFEFANDLCVDGIVQEMSFWIRTCAVGLEVFRHVLIHIVGLNLIAETLCVGKQQPLPICAILTLDMVVLKIVH